MKKKIIIQLEPYTKYDKIEVGNFYYIYDFVKFDETILDGTRLFKLKSIGRSLDNSHIFEIHEAYIIKDGNLVQITGVLLRESFKIGNILCDSKFKSRHTQVEEPKLYNEDQNKKPIKKVKIKYCMECPYFSHDNTSYGYCYLTDNYETKRHKIDGISEKCPMIKEDILLTIKKEV